MDSDKSSAVNPPAPVANPAAADQAHAPADQKTEQTAARDLSSHLRLWLIAAFGLALDLWTKHLAFARLDGDPRNEHGFVAIPGLMSFRRSLNPGALFGLGKGLTPIFIGASLLALGFVLYLFLNSGRSRRSLHVALALVLAGALGNLFDRTFMIADVVKYDANGKRYTVAGKVVNPGETPVELGVWPEGSHPRRIPAEANPEIREMGVVRDFIKMEPHFEVLGFRVDMWPWVFNIADVLLVVGVGLLMLNFWWERKAELAAEKAQAEAAAKAGDSSGSV